MANQAEGSQGDQSQPGQRYDTTFKEWIEWQVSDILPVLLPGATYQQTLTIELIKPTLRADKVFKVLYIGEDRIFNPEFETGSDNKMASRLHVYNAILFHDHQIPVISMIIYPFRTTVAQPPLLIPKDGGIIRFDYQILELYKQDAEQYVRNHVRCMYPMLPTMQGTDHLMIRRVMGELQEIYRDDVVPLAQQYIWINLLLERTTTISRSEKGEIFKELSMYEALWDQSPRVQQIRAESEAEGRMKGRMEGRAEGLNLGLTQGITQGITQGEARALRRILVHIVKARFPALNDLAEQEAERLNKPDALDLLIQQIVIADDEKLVHWLLKSVEK